MNLKNQRSSQKKAPQSQGRGSASPSQVSPFSEKYLTKNVHQFDQCSEDAVSSPMAETRRPSDVTEFVPTTVDSKPKLAANLLTSVMSYGTSDIVVAHASQQCPVEGYDGPHESEQKAFTEREKELKSQFALLKKENAGESLNFQRCSGTGNLGELQLSGTQQKTTYDSTTATKAAKGQQIMKKSKSRAQAEAALKKSGEMSTSSTPWQLQVCQPVCHKLPISAELLRCQEELLNPEEDLCLTKAALINDCPRTEAPLLKEQRPVLKLCLGLPSSKKTNPFTAPSVRTDNSGDLLKDASGFGGQRDHGIPYLRQQRKLLPLPEPLTQVKVTELLALPKRLVDPDALAVDKADKKGLSRRYLQSQTFNQVFNLKPVFTDPQLDKQNDQTRQTASNVKTMTDLSQNKDSECQQCSDNNSSTQQSATCQQVSSMAAPQTAASNNLQQTQQNIAQRRHILSKRTRVSAQNSMGLEYFNSSSTAMVDPDLCHNSQHTDVEGVTSHQSIALKRFKSDNTLPKLSINKHPTSVQTLSTQASLTSSMRANSLTSITDVSLMGCRPNDSRVIENDTKEVLLRMFEHLIAKEKASATKKTSTQAPGIKHRRQAKALSKLSQSQVRRRSQRLAPATSTESIQEMTMGADQTVQSMQMSPAANDRSAAVDNRVSSSPHNAVICSDEGAAAMAINLIEQRQSNAQHERALTVGPDGIYHIQFQSSAVEEE